jgi:hypothetical protein
MVTVLFDLFLLGAGAWSVRLLVLKINAERRASRAALNRPDAPTRPVVETWSDDDDLELSRLLDGPRQ